MSSPYVPADVALLIQKLTDQLPWVHALCPEMGYKETVTVVMGRPCVVCSVSQVLGAQILMSGKFLGDIFCS